MPPLGQNTLPEPTAYRLSKQVYLPDPVTMDQHQDLHDQK